MAAAAKILANKMEELENSFLFIFFEAANKIAKSTESKLFFIMESSDGVRKIGGNQELRELFQIGTLVPQYSDIVMDEGSFTREGHADKNHVAGNDFENVRKRKYPTQDMSAVVSRKRHKTIDFPVKEEGCVVDNEFVEEEGEDEEEENEEEDEEEKEELRRLYKHEDVDDSTSEGADTDDNLSFDTEPTATKEG